MSIFQKFLKKTKKVDSVDRTLLSNDIKLSNAEILFLIYLNGFDPSYNFPQYWDTVYNINAKAVLKKMLNNDYIRLATIQENLQYYTVTELKEVLKANNLKSSGKKDLLISTLQQNLSTEELEYHFKKTTYALTEKSMTYMEQAEFLSFFHKNMLMGLSIDAAQFQKDKNPDWNKYQIALFLLNEQLIDNNKSKDWGLYRNTLLNFSEIYKMAEDYEKHFEYLCVVCYYDLSGLGNGDSICRNPDTEPVHTITERLNQARNKLSLSDVDFRKSYLDIVEKIKLQRSHCTPEISWTKIANQIL